MDLDELRLRYNLQSIPQHNRFDIQYPLREAAVLIAITQIDNEPSLILTKRPTHLRAHPGQISFPGGKAESSDSSLIATALREAEEEIGLKNSNIEIIGDLPNHKTFTGFDIKPVVGIVKHAFEPQLDPGEVEDCFTVPLSFLLSSSNRHTQLFERNGQIYPVHFITFKQRFIWGATAAMIDLLCSHISR